MPDFQAIPLIVDKHAIRVDPFESSATSSAAATAGPSGNSRTSGRATSHNASGGPSVNTTVVDDLADDGELDDTDVAELQKAAEAGDSEANELLKQLGIPLAGVAALTGGVIGGKMLMDARARARARNGSDFLPDGSPKFVNGADIPKSEFIPGDIPAKPTSNRPGVNVKYNPQLSTYAPSKVGTQVQTGPAPAPLKVAPPDQPYKVKLGQTLREAATAVRRKR